MEYKDLPHNIEAEKAIFSSILGNPDILMNFVDSLQPSDFFLEAHQHIWDAIKGAFFEGQELDMVTIKGQLVKKKVAVKPTLITLSECYEQVVNVGNIKSFIDEVRNKSLLRQIFRSSQAHMHMAQVEGASSEIILTNIEKDLVNIVDRTKDKYPSDLVGIMDELQQDIVKVQKEGWRGLNTGFYELDEKTGGLIPAQIWVIGAYTGIGKTFFILQLILNVLYQGGKVVLFSTEMDRKLILLRMIGNIANLGTIKMMKNLLTEEERDRMSKAQETMRSFKGQLFIYDTIYTVEQMKLKAKKLKLKENIDLVVVDYIQNMRGKGELYERMSDASLEFQQMTLDLKITLIIGSQVSQASAGWKSKDSIDFKGAGEIAAVADAAIWLSGIEGDPEIRKVHMRKVRHGSRGKFEIKASFPSGKMTSLSEIDSIANSEGGGDDVVSQL